MTRTNNKRRSPSAPRRNPRADLLNVICQEVPPGLRGRSSWPNQIFRDARLTHVDPEFQQLAMDAGSAPQGIGLRHRADQRADGRRYGRSTETATALPRPPEAERATVPGNNGLWPHDDDCGSPLRPDLRQPDPQEPVGLGQVDPATARSLEDVKLVSQDEDLELQRPSRAQRQSRGSEAPQTPHFVSPENRYCGRFATPLAPGFFIASRVCF